MSVPTSYDIPNQFHSLSQESALFAVPPAPSFLFSILFCLLSCFLFCLLSCFLSRNLKKGSDMCKCGHTFVSTVTRSPTNTTGPKVLKPSIYLSIYLSSVYNIYISTSIYLSIYLYKAPRCYGSAQGRRGEQSCCCST